MKSLKVWNWRVLSVKMILQKILRQDRRLGMNSIYHFICCSFWKFDPAIFIFLLPADFFYALPQRYWFWPILSKESEFAAFSKSERWKRFVPLRKCWGGASDTVLQKTVIIFRFSYQIYLVNFFLLHFKQKIVKLS